MKREGGKMFLRLQDGDHALGYWLIKTLEGNFFNRSLPV